MESKTYYINEDANGLIFVSKRPMNQVHYCTPARIKCIDTKVKKITRTNIFAGAICETVTGEILKIIKVKNRCGYERKYIHEGQIGKIK